MLAAFPYWINNLGYEQICNLINVFLKDKAGGAGGKRYERWSVPVLEATDKDRDNRVKRMWRKDFMKHWVHTGTAQSQQWEEMTERRGQEN